MANPFEGHGHINLTQCRVSHDTEPLGKFAAVKLVQIEEDRSVLEQIIDRLGGKTDAVKQTVGWAAEKVTRLKLRLSAEDDFGCFESLEILSLGIQGKLARWR